MKKGWIITGVILAILVGGGFAAKAYVSNKIADEVVKMTEDPEVKKQIDKAIAELNKQQQAGNIKLPGNLQGTDKSSAPNGTAAQGTGTGTATAGGSGQSSSSSSSSGSQATGLSFASRAEAIAYAQSKFSAAEIAHYTNAVMNKSKLSKAEKDAIKQEILSRFTAEELRALQQAASK